MENPYATKPMSDMPVAKSTFLASVLIALFPFVLLLQTMQQLLRIPRELWDVFSPTLFSLLHLYHF